MRVAKDIDGHDGRQWGAKKWYFYNDILDAESHSNDWAPRFYQGNVSFDGVVRGTKLTIGRMYAEHLNSFQIDGGNLDVGFLDGRLGVFAYGGLPVSYFVDTKESWLAGGGLFFKPLDSLNFTGEYVYSDVLDDRVSVVKLRGDWTYDYGYLYGQYGNNDGKNFYELGTVFRYQPTKTTVAFTFEHLIDSIGDSVNYYSSPLAYVLSPYGKYIKGKLRIQQGITDFLLAGAGVEYKNAYGTKDWDNRNYARYFGNIDLVGLPFRGTYLSISADYWDVSAVGSISSNNQLTFGAELTQVLTDTADIWLGTSFDRFRFDAETGDYKDWVRSYYVGAQWRISRMFAVTADFTYEDSQILRTDGSNLVNNFLVQCWLNIAI